ncbi:MAG: flagellar biosynthesis anti-sigma factor FlgM [Synergistaceae bacterium]|jgi:flagellar biosynthesis anti-sigma factor FlgM|nr:flagellar biosynthesis anti-sigma factor FlgM [Synergistaceae bacterium]
MIEKINDVTGISGAEPLKQKRGSHWDAEELSVASDGFAVSSFAREMANISTELSKIPDVREDLVSGIKKRIDEGTYEPDLNALANRLIWAGINKKTDL